GGCQARLRPSVRLRVVLVLSSLENLKGEAMPHTTNQKVVIWAQGQLGKKIGKGECWDLAEQALKQAGAQTSNHLGPVEQDSDYIWGDSIDIKDVIPGEIGRASCRERV